MMYKKVTQDTAVSKTPNPFCLSILFRISILSCLKRFLSTVSKPSRNKTRISSFFFSHIVLEICAAESSSLVSAADIKGTKIILLSNIIGFKMNGPKIDMKETQIGLLLCKVQLSKKSEEGIKRLHQKEILCYWKSDCCVVCNIS